MNYIKIIRAVSRELDSQISGIEAIFNDGIHLRLTDPAIITDLSRLAHRYACEIPKPPVLYEPGITLHGDQRKSYFPWLSPFSEYLEKNRSVLENEFIVSFVKGTVTERTNKKYLRERRSALENKGIDRDRQILILLNGRIPESVTQKLVVYYLTTKGWMVTEDNWYSPNLHFGRSHRNRFHGYGIPDIVAWKSELVSELAKRGWIRNGGTIHELACLSIREPFSKITPASSTKEQTLVGEVKGSKRSIGEPMKQLYNRGNRDNPKPGYLRSNCFDEGYGIVPLQVGKDRKGGGVISFDEQGFYIKEDSVDETFRGKNIEGETRADPKKKQQLIEHLDTIAVQTLLCNVSMPEALDINEIDKNTYPSEFLREVLETSKNQIIRVCEDRID